jgi:hypothetical protein
MKPFANGNYHESCFPAYYQSPEVDSFVVTLNELRIKKDYKPLNWYFRDADKPIKETFFSSKEARNQVE